MARNKIRNVLFLSTRNAARSIMAECILNRAGQGRFRAFSAGSQPDAAVDPRALALLSRHGYAIEGLRTTAWDAFAGDGAPALDLVVTLSDTVVGDVCAVFWTGRPATTHWGLPDPATAADDDSRRKAFDDVYAALCERIDAFLALPFDSLDRLTLQGRLDAIGIR